VTEKNPTWIDGIQVSGQELRQALGGMFNPSSSGPINARSAVLPSPNNPLRVTALGTPNMTVDVAAGQAVVAGSETANMGTALLTNDATVNLAIAASDATNPRIDLVVARWYSETVAVGLREFALEVVTGSPAASPVQPTTPANSIILATIAVAAGVTSITSGVITDTRDLTAALGGVISCLSTGRPGGVYSGLPIYERDTGQDRYWDGSAWVLRHAPSLGDIGAGAAGTVTTSYANLSTRCSIVVPAGRWVIQAKGTFSVSESTGRLHSARLFDGTTSLDSASARSSRLDAVQPFSMLYVATFTAASTTIDVQWKVDTVEGTQTLTDAVITAIAG
jgi:hypothetical protein